tara:strand:- start:120 stop:554 length:435 start_codon:yes stop_codon:yes gene_type:complete
MKTEDYYESKLYMGSETFFDDEQFSQEEVELFIGVIQDDYHVTIPVRVTPVTFVSGSDYKESGWEIAAINYPKVKATPSVIDKFMKDLAEKLLNRFNQYTICVMDSEFVTMFKGTKRKTGAISADTRSAGFYFADQWWLGNNYG